LLLDRFLENAIEVDVDALADGERCFVAGVMQHVEEAGVHSGDSACVIPPMSLGEEMLEEIRATTRQIALELGVIGLINIQYAVAGADSVLGPEMKSTGEVMGIAGDFPTAFGKAQAAAGVTLPSSGSVFITVTDSDKPAATQIAARFHDLGFEVIATGGTAQAISRMGVPVTRINKIGEGSPHVVDLIREHRCDLVINTPTGSGARADGQAIRTAAVRHGIPCVTTMTGASAAVRAIS